MYGTSSTIRRRALRIATACVVVTSGLVGAAAATTHASPYMDIAVTICRATNSHSQPYVLESVSPIDLVALPGSPSAMLIGPIWTDSAPFWGDIVPPIAGYVPNGQNWASGAAILNNNCAIPQSNAAPVTSSTLAPTTTLPGGETTTTVAYDNGGGVEVQGPVVNPTPHVLPSTGSSVPSGVGYVGLVLFLMGLVMLYVSRTPRAVRRRS